LGILVKIKRANEFHYRAIDEWGVRCFGKMFLAILDK
jgi:hypothetical protein